VKESDFCEEKSAQIMLLACYIKVSAQTDNGWTLHLS